MNVNQKVLLQYFPDVFDSTDGFAKFLNQAAEVEDGRIIAEIAPGVVIDLLTGKAYNPEERVAPEQQIEQLTGVPAPSLIPTGVPDVAPQSTQAPAPMSVPQAAPNVQPQGAQASRGVQPKAAAQAPNQERAALEELRGLYNNLMSFDLKGAQQSQPAPAGAGPTAQFVAESTLKPI